VEKSYARYKKHGWEGMVYRLNKECLKLHIYRNTAYCSEKEYKKWIKKNEKNILRTETLKYNPLISIITPTYETDKKYLTEMLESVVKQTYKNWELCIADDASKNKQTLKILKKYELKYKNIKIKYREKNGHISKASNTALSLATGEYIALLDHDDTLSVNALYEIVKKLNENRELKLIYSDEDKIDKRSRRYMPHFKSSWNKDMFFAQIYM
jgi:glycosyltransferase involved in cell wall biosynthesis